MASSTPSSKLQEQLSAAMPNKDNQLEQIRELIAAGADINKPDKHGITPLHWAVCWGSTEMVKYLVEETNAGAE